MWAPRRRHHREHDRPTTDKTDEAQAEPGHHTIGLVLLASAQESNRTACQSVGTHGRLDSIRGGGLNHRRTSPKSFERARPELAHTSRTLPAHTQTNGPDPSVSTVACVLFFFGYVHAHMPPIANPETRTPPLRHVYVCICTPHQSINAPGAAAAAAAAPPPPPPPVPRPPHAPQTTRASAGQSTPRPPPRPGRGGPRGGRTRAAKSTNVCRCGSPGPSTPTRGSARRRAAGRPW